MDYLQYKKIVLGNLCLTLQWVLNLVINGLPSIRLLLIDAYIATFCFKPCYKWITFNTLSIGWTIVSRKYCFKPCYKWITFNTKSWPTSWYVASCFKPCYKWITFNTPLYLSHHCRYKVLNLVINGLPSILQYHNLII